MPSFQDSAFIFFLALLLFGPRKLPELARQLGKLMGEFRRASNEFRMQMEDELRVAEQQENQKKIAAIEAAAPVTPALEEPAPSATVNDHIDEHPHMPSPVLAEPEGATEPLPIAVSGDLNLMPPSTGLPLGRSTSTADLSPMLDSIPHSSTPDETQHTGSAPVTAIPAPAAETVQHG